MVQQFIVGHVGQPHGLEGFVKIHSASGEWEHLLALKEILLCGKTGEKTCVVEETRANSGQILMKFRGIETPEAARTLSGAALITGRERAAPLAENEYYIEDLKGLEVVSPGAQDALPEQTAVGTVNDVIEGGGGWLVEVRLLSGKTHLVPFRKEFFGDMDSEKRTIPLLSEWILE
ncbi:MAG: ribosome maturation factor RimM [Spirochaetaceae bacterium]|jgi:16S rRNA processing protein RimM|nr:ribosome maturation factor RimM [Spirochaetaceae bacterium]